MPAQGFHPEGEIPRGHLSSSRVHIYRKVLTVEINGQYTRKNLDLLDKLVRAAGNRWVNDDVSAVHVRK